MTPLEALPFLTKAGYSTEANATELRLNCGESSGNLECLCVGNGANGYGTFMDALNGHGQIIDGFPVVQAPGGIIQYFYRCTQVEASRQLTTHIRLVGEGSSVATFPTEGYSLLSGKLTKVPTISWSDRCKLLDAVLAIEADPPTPPVHSIDEAIGAAGVTITEENIARLFEQKHADELRYCNAWGKWLRWDGARWKPEDTLLAFDYCRQLTRNVNRTMAATPAKASFARGVESFARSSRPFATETREWDQNQWYLNTPSGTLDLRSGRMLKHTQTDHITKLTNIAPSAGKRPMFERFLRDIACEDEALVEYLQTSLGACLSGAIQEHWLLIWIGDGRNGKNTLGDLVQWILGDYASALPTSALMAQKQVAHPTDIASLRGLRLAVSSEVSEGSFWDEAKISELSGDAVLKGRFMRQDTFTFPRTHKHLIYGNHRPMLRVVNDAVKHRLHLVPFKARFIDETCDPLMPQKLKTEAAQVLHWLIEGHAKWLEAGSLKRCSAVQAETDTYFQNQSTPDMWVAECCILGHNETDSARDLYASFKSWKESRGEGVMSQTRWGEWMQRYDRGISSSKMYYRGLSIRPQVSDVNARY